MSVDLRAKGCDQAAVSGACNFRNPAFYLAGIARADWNDIGTQRTRDRLNDGELPDARGHGRVSNHSNADGRRRYLFEQFKPFAAQTVFELHEARYVAAGMREALDEAAAHGIDGRREHHGYSVGRLEHRWSGGAAARDDDVRRLGQQFGDALAKISGIRPDTMDGELQVLAIDPAETAQLFREN